VARDPNQGPNAEPAPEPDLAEQRAPEPGAPLLHPPDGGPPVVISNTGGALGVGDGDRQTEQSVGGGSLLPTNPPSGTAGVD
jgi:hypothetical protein